MGKSLKTINNSTGIFMGFSDDYLLGVLETVDFPDNFLIPVIEKYKYTIMGMSGILDKQLEMNNLPVIVFEYEEDMSFRNYGRKLSDLITFLSKYNYRFERFFGENYLLLPPNK